MKAAKKVIESRIDQPGTKIDIIPVPVLNEKAYRGNLGEFCDIATEGSEADPAAVLLTTLTRFSIEIGNSAHVMIGDTRHSGNLFAVLVGRSAKARKGTSYSPVKRLFKALIEIDECWELSSVKPGPLSSGEGLIFEVRDADVEFDKKKQEQIVKDIGVEDKRLFIISEELAGALTVMRKDGNILSMVFRSLWDDGNASPITKFNRIQTTGAHVGIVAHITRHELLFKLSTNEILNGFANRFLWFFVQRQKLVPDPKKIPDDELIRLAKRLMKIIRFARKVGEMNFNERARQFWIDIYPEVSREEDGDIGVINNRLEALTIRVAMLYALLEMSDVIRKRHLISALAVTEYSRESVKYIFTKREGDPMAEKIANALQAAHPKGLTKTAINSGVFNRNVSSSKLNEVLKGLVLSGLIKKKSKKAKSGKGQPTTIYKLVVEKN